MMKIRTGFVSNSSSSSFMLIVNKDFYNKKNIPDKLNSIFQSHSLEVLLNGKKYYIVNKPNLDNQYSKVENYDDDLLLEHSPQNYYGGELEACLYEVLETYLGYSRRKKEQTKTVMSNVHFDYNYY